MWCHPKHLFAPFFFSVLIFSEKLMTTSGVIENSLKQGGAGLVSSANAHGCMYLGSSPLSRDTQWIFFSSVKSSRIREICIQTGKLITFLVACHRCQCLFVYTGNVSAVFSHVMLGSHLNLWSCLFRHCHACASGMECEVFYLRFKSVFFPQYVRQTPGWCPVKTYI